MALKTLADANRQACELYESLRRPKQNGIACPQCGQELLDKNIAKVLTVWPPRLEVMCVACGYEGTRVK